MEATWTDKNPLTGSRTQADIDALLDQLRENPGRWSVYSEHVSRGAARQRVIALRGAKMFEGYPLRWATKRVQPGNIHAPVQVLVCWDETGDAAAPDAEQ